jgi:hypothetical protein
VRRGEGVLELAISFLGNSLRGVVDIKSCMECCEGNGLLLLVPIAALSGGIPKRGGVGLVRYLLGGVKDNCQMNGRLATASKVQLKFKLTANGSSV